MSVLDLRERDREITDQAARTPHRYLDLVVDGRSVGDALRAAIPDLITPLWVDDDVAREESLLAVRRLRGEVPGDLHDGRVLIYGCGECTDVSCGGASIRLTIGDDTVEWSEWGWENDWDDAITPLDDEVDLPERLVFDRRAYDAALARAAERIAGGAA